MLLKILDDGDPPHAAIVDVFWEVDKNGKGEWWWFSKTPGAFANLYLIRDSSWPLPAYTLGQDDGRKSMILAQLVDSVGGASYATRCTLHNFGVEVIANGSTGVISAYRQNGGILKFGPAQWLGRLRS
jgi:hypothetical protein